MLALDKGLANFSINDARVNIVAFAGHKAHCNTKAAIESLSGFQISFTVMHHITFQSTGNRIYNSGHKIIMKIKKCLPPSDVAVEMS